MVSDSIEIAGGGLEMAFDTVEMAGGGLEMASDTEGMAGGGVEMASDTEWMAGGGAEMASDTAVMAGGGVEMAIGGIEIDSDSVWIATDCISLNYKWRKTNTDNVEKVTIILFFEGYHAETRTCQWELKNIFIKFDTRLSVYSVFLVNL